MGNHSNSTSSQDPHTIFGIGSICKAYKSFVSKFYPVRNRLQKKAKAKEKIKSVDQEHCKDKHSKEDEEGMKNVQDLGYVGNGFPKGVLKRQNSGNIFTRSTSTSTPSASRTTSPFCLLSRTTSRTTTPPSAASLSRSTSRVNSVDPAALARSLSRTTSKSSTPIMFSNSHGVLKPPPMEMTIECTLEELCFGCIKKIQITRDAVTNHGQVIEEDELLTIKVKPGWTNGTKITFEGMGDEMPGTDPADVIFEITQKRHELYIRKGDDLELAVKIPLVKALTGGDISIPLLGGEAMSLEIDEIICPGHRKIIDGQGMPKPKEQGQRGNLIITYFVEFPEKLTDDQRSEVSSVLDDSCYSSS